MACRESGRSVFPPHLLAIVLISETQSLVTARLRDQLVWALVRPYPPGEKENPFSIIDAGATFSYVKAKRSRNAERRCTRPRGATRIRRLGRSCGTTLINAQPEPDEFEVAFIYLFLVLTCFGHAIEYRISTPNKKRN